MRVLLVEDHPDTAQVMARCLRRMGHRTAIATTKAKAKALCETDHFNVMISDIMLPDGEAWSLASLAQRRGIIPIAMTAISMPADIDRNDDSGFAAHLRKPVSFDDLHELFNRLANEPGLKEGMGDWITLEESR